MSKIEEPKISKLKMFICRAINQ